MVFESLAHGRIYLYQSAPAEASARADWILRRRVTAQRIDANAVALVLEQDALLASRTEVEP